MNITSTQHIHNAHSLQGPHRSAASRETAPTARQTGAQDEIRFSEEALNISRGETENKAGSTPIRFDLVNRIKSEIAAGTYDTPDKMEIALSRMIGKAL
jgi:anti-sigma28 factor (negative regulator of flagellin synthesis)